MKLINNNIKAMMVGLFGLSVLASCSDTDPNFNEEIDKTKKSTVLIYAVATNSLSGDLVSDKSEMIQAAPNIDLEKNNVLLFQTRYKYLEDNTRTKDVSLVKLSKKEETDGYDWEILKEYNDEVESLDPNRVTEIINYVTDNYKAEKYGIVFWSHSTASQPNFPEVTYRSAAEGEDDYTVKLPALYSFGQDLMVSDETYKYLNIDDMADAIPDHLFDYIWFDSCYMSNIETIYQLRNKCKTFVGYPTEVLGNGLPYDLVLPFMVGENIDLVYAASLFYKYYANSFGTIAVVDMDKIDVLADYCRGMFTPGVTVPSTSLFKYTRFTTGPFYDFGDYVKAMANAEGIEITNEEWDEILAECVIYKAASERDLTNTRIDPETYSGISTHLYNFTTEDSESEAYYKSLDWYREVFEK